MKHLCPVCGYNELPEPPQDYNICPCCGTEFGYTDFTASHESLRDRWVQRGMTWHSRRVSPPLDWNPEDQLMRAGFANTPRPKIPA